MIVAARVLLLLLAIAATVSAFALHRGHSESGGSAASYVCPMHPEVTSATSGPCSICRMALEPVQRSKQEHSAAAASASFSLDPSASLEDFKVIGTATRRAFAIGVRAPAFIESEDRILAVLRKDELIGLSPEEGAWFFRATAPRERIEVQLAVEPPAPQDPSTVRVHLHPAPGAPKLRPGQTGWVELATRSRELLLVPSGAVLYSAQGPYVLVAGADNRTFVTRQLEIGSVSGGFAVILSGLQEGERIAVGSAFSLDAERRLEAERQLSAAVMP